VIDNGCGFDLQRVQPKGLSSLRSGRSRWPELEVSSAPGVRW